MHYFDKTALHLAIEKENVEIVRLLLERDDLDVNINIILNNYII